MWLNRSTAKCSRPVCTCDNKFEDFRCRIPHHRRKNGAATSRYELEEMRLFSYKILSGEITSRMHSELNNPALVVGMDHFSKADVAAAAVALMKADDFTDDIESLYVVQGRVFDGEEICWDESRKWLVRRVGLNTNSFSATFPNYPGDRPECTVEVLARLDEQRTESSQSLEFYVASLFLHLCIPDEIPDVRCDEILWTGLRNNDVAPMTIACGCGSDSEVRHLRPGVTVSSQSITKPFSQPPH